MNICFACLHLFPASAVTTLPLDAQVMRRFESLRASVAALPQSSSVLHIEEDIKGVVRCLQLLQEQHRSEVEYLKDQRKNGSDHDPGPVVAPKAPVCPRTPLRAEGGAISGGGLQRLLSSPRHESTLCDTTRFGVTHSSKPMTASLTKPLEQVSASIFNLLEALTVKTRAALGIVWVAARSSEDLVATFVAGSKVPPLRKATPPHVGRHTIVGVVAATGVAVNLQGPSCGTCTDGAVVFAHFLQSQVMRNSTLIVPIFPRYAGNAHRSCLGAVQLIGESALAVPFNAEDERQAEVCSGFLTHIVSSYYDFHAGEWTTKPFDSTAMSSTASYVAHFDQRAASKGTDEFAGRPLLMYRAPLASPLEQASNPKHLKNVVQKSSSPLQVGGHIREIHSYIKSLEDTWKSSAVSTTVGTPIPTPPIAPVRRKHQEHKRSCPGTPESVKKTFGILEVETLELDILQKLNGNMSSS